MKGILTYITTAAIAVAAVALLASCESKSPRAVEFTLSVGMDSEDISTRAGSDIHTRTFDVGETFVAEFDGNVNVPGTTYTVASLGGDICYVTPSETTTVAEGEIAEVQAWYPAKVNPGIQTDQSTEAGYKASDYMTGTGKINGGTTAQTVTIGSHSVTLQPGHGRIIFTHANAKVLVNAIAKSDLKIQGIALDPDGVDIKMYGNTVGESSVHCAALLAPGSYSGNILVVTTDKGTVTYVLNSASSLEQNYVYTLNIDVAHVNTVVSIEDWDNVLQPVGEAQWQE